MTTTTKSSAATVAATIVAALAECERAAMLSPHATSDQAAIVNEYGRMLDQVNQRTVTNRAGGLLIADRLPFTNSSGSFSARWYSPARGAVSRGELPWTDFDQLSSIWYPTYVVYSYATPIAWSHYYGNRYSGLALFIPQRSYSPTTNRHQAIVRASRVYSGKVGA